jgi:hypothetical protein
MLAPKNVKKTFAFHPTLFYLTHLASFSKIKKLIPRELLLRFLTFMMKKKRIMWIV